MTERERWIVYPLLFLALGTSLRGKLGLAEDEIAAKKIVIVDADGKPTILFKDGVVTAKKVEETEPLKAKQVIIKDMVCENLLVQKNAIVNNEILSRRNISGEIAVVDPRNENVIIARIGKSPSGASGSLVLSSSNGSPVIGMGSSNGVTGAIELIQRKNGQNPIVGTIINADGKGNLELTPIAKQKIETKSAATKKKAAEDKANEKNESEKDDPPAKENEE
jgi:hypothetical protein